MKIVAYSIGVNWGNYQFGTHRVWEVYHYGVDAENKALEHIEFLNRHKPEEEARLLVLYN